MGLSALLSEYLLKHILSNMHAFYKTFKIQQCTSILTVICSLGMSNLSQTSAAHYKEQQGHSSK